MTIHTRHSDFRKCVWNCAKNNFGWLIWVTDHEYSITFKRGAPRLEVSPRFVGVYSYTSPRMTTFTKAHTHTHIPTHHHCHIFRNFLQSSFGPLVR